MLLFRALILTLVSAGLIGCLQVQNPPPDFHHPASADAAEAPIPTTSNTLVLPEKEGKP